MLKVSDTHRSLLIVTLLLSAFLLFCFQPMVGKMVLPLLGGAAAVWTTAVLFFQLMLLAGYFYAHQLAQIRAFRPQIIIHLVIMGGALLFLPVRFGEDSLGADSFRQPVLRELLGLLKTAGIPCFMVSTTAPLLQAWFSRADDSAGRDPYFLYAASNAGSLLALLAYPFFIEPAFGVREQSVYWTVGYGVLVVLSAAVSVTLLRRHDGLARLETPAAADPDFKARVYWVTAAFVPSGLMLAVTTHISVNLVPMPLVWTLPLAVYLITFILAFGRRIRVSSERIAQLSLPIIVLVCPVVGLQIPVVFSIDVVLIGIHLVLLFVGGLLCHTALADNRPDRRYLTDYYVCVALGGVLGGIFAALVAPLVFTNIFEYPLLLALSLFFRKALGKNRWVVATTLAGMVLGYALYLPSVLGEKGAAVHVTRNFFGVKRVIDTTTERKLLHGDTLHGVENRDAAMSAEPTIYYRRDGPLGDVIEMMQTRPDQHVAVVGLGAGAVAAYAGPHRRITFIEIDPEVDSIAREYFTFLSRCGSQCDVVLGDGRLTIARSPEHGFDLIVLDAFSSDAIPAHLVSREALDVYLSRLKPDGVILFHVSNRYLRVKDLVAALVTAAELPSLVRVDRGTEAAGKSDSIYVAASRSRESLARLTSLGTWKAVQAPPDVTVWSDDYSNLVNLLEWRLDPS